MLQFFYHLIAEYWQTLFLISQKFVILACKHLIPFHGIVQVILSSFAIGQAMSGFYIFSRQLE